MTDKADTMADAPVIGAAGPLPDGFIVQGEFVGFKASKPFTNRSTGKEGMTKPKVGIRLPSGEVVQVVVPDDDVARTIGRNYGRVDRIAVAVRPRAPFGSTEPIRYSLIGTEDDDGGWD